MAIHATDLLYDIALPLSCYSFVLSFSVSPSARSLLSALLALTLIPLRSFIFAIMASCIFFSLRHRGVRKYTLSRAPYGDYNRIADSSAINPSRLRAHPPPPPLHVVIGFRGRIPPRTICLTHSNRGYYRTAIFISISKPSLGPVFLARKFRAILSRGISTTNAPH